jgi:hypothetical protein
VGGGEGLGDGKTQNVVSPPPPPPTFVQGNEVPSPAVPPAPPFPSGPAVQTACGGGDIARSCVGECGMCIFAPDADTPNCCCDGECAEMGDCCGDFKTCCGGGSRLEPDVRVDARAGANRRVARRYDDAFFFPTRRSVSSVSRRGRGGSRRAHAWWRPSRSSWGAGETRAAARKGRHFDARVTDERRRRAPYARIRASFTKLHCGLVTARV